MSSSVMPWSIKGVSLEARSLAKSAAGESGRPIGAWLNQLIRAASRAEREAQSTQALAAAEPPPAANWRAEIEELTQRIAKLEQRAQALVAPLDQAVERIAQRLEAIEARRLVSPSLTSPTLDDQGPGLAG